MWSHHGKKSRQIKFYLHLHWLHPNPCLKVRDFRFPGWFKCLPSPTCVCFSSGFSFFRPPNAPTPAPTRWCCWCYLWSLAEIQVVQWILPFRILWRWLKVDGTPFTWYFRITKITKLLSGGLVKIQNSCGRHSRPLRRDRGKSFAMTITFWSTVAVALWHRIYRSSMRTKCAVSSSKI